VAAILPNLPLQGNIRTNVDSAPNLLAAFILALMTNVLTQVTQSWIDITVHQLNQGESSSHDVIPFPVLDRNELAEASPSKPPH
jgi:hypothetical protein